MESDTFIDPDTNQEYESYGFGFLGIGKLYYSKDGKSGIIVIPPCDKDKTQNHFGDANE